LSAQISGKKLLKLFFHPFFEGNAMKNYSGTSFPGEKACPYILLPFFPGKCVIQLFWQLFPREIDSTELPVGFCMYAMAYFSKLCLLLVH